MKTRLRISHYSGTMALCLIVLLLAGIWAMAAYNRARIRPWSAPATWGGHPPAAGADITIPAGRTVLLDCNPPPLHSLEIDGTLIFKDRDVSLTAGSILVHGRMIVGTHADPFRHRVLITLTGKDLNEGPKVLQVAGGALDLHGEVRGPTWTHLAQTAPAGSAQLVLETAPLWRPGDQLVLASTDFDPLQAEEPVVKSISGREITLQAPLKYTHWGKTEFGVDERAEVGLLTHNIVVQGDNNSPAQGFGGQLMVCRSGSARIEGVAFTQMGQKGRLGCYPVHFHMLGEGRGCYVRDCSIFHCYNRCLTVHGTHDVLVERNVAYDTIGHCYFMEDGIETGNVYLNNLGVLARKAKKGEAILPSDLTPAVFWITNPGNTFVGNVAAGSQGNGFWLSFPKHPTGPSRTPETDRSVWPRRSAIGLFANNVAHSCDNDGLFVDNGPNPPGVTETPNYDPPKEADFVGMTAYKNRRRGMWLRGSRLVVSDAKLADNSIGFTFAASKSELRDSLIVGETGNLGTPATGDPTGPRKRSLPKPFEPHFPIRGFEFYDGLVGAKNITFVNFEPNPVRAASALSYLRFTPFFIDQRNSIAGARFINSDPVYFETRGTPGDKKQGGDGYRSAAFLDTDGTVTGRAGVFVTVNNPFLVDDHATVRPKWDALISTAPFGRLFIDNRDKSPSEISPVSLVRLDPKPTTQNMWGIPESGPDISFQTTLIANKSYALHFAGPEPAHLRLSLRYRNPGDWVQIALPFAGAQPLIYRDKDTKTPLSPAPTLAAFQQTNGASYYLAKGILYVKLVVLPGSLSGEAVLNISQRLAENAKAAMKPMVLRSKT